MIKRVALLVVLLLQFHVVTPHTQIAQQTESRKTSTPYTGDLSIFDSPGRDERQQINRVMDMLAIALGKTVAGYHEVAQPITLLRNLRRSLASGARIGVIDRNGNGENHGVVRKVVIR